MSVPTLKEAIVKALFEGDKTVNQLHEAVKVVRPSCPLSSISGTLTRLSAEGVVSKTRLRFNKWELSSKWLEETAPVCPECGYVYYNIHDCS